jgi:hypothetical protein
MSYKLFLDDVRVPYDVFRMTILPIYENDSDWVIVKSFGEFVDILIAKGIPDVISFDHDLSYDHYLEENQSGDIEYDSLGEKTGYDAAKMLVHVCQEQNKELPMYYVHSANPVGAENIKRYLENAKKHLENIL